MRRPRIGSAVALVTCWPLCANAGTVSQWLFHSDHVSGSVVSDLAGDFDATIHGAVNLTATPPALVLDGGANYLSMGNNVGSFLPRRDISVEAWVRIRSGTRWGGIIGYVQDNGDDEHGWVLGYDDVHFTFAVADRSAITYLTGTTAFSPDEWFHVVGTYDGTTMKIYVNGALENSSAARSGDISYRDATYVMGVYHDDNEHFPMDGRLHAVSVHDSVLLPAEIQSRYDAKKPILRGDPLPEPSGVIAVGPYVQFNDASSATVHWHTPTASASILEYGRAEVSEERVEDASEKLVHAVTITGLKRNTEYLYRLKRVADGGEIASDTYSLETDFNFCLPNIPDRPSPYEDGDISRMYAEAAEGILSETGVSQGYCLVLGAGRGQLMYELAKRSQLAIVGVDTDGARVAEARRALLHAGVYGPRANVRQVASYSNLPFTKYFANLIVSDHVMAEGECVGNAEEMFRVLRPVGGVALFGQLAGSPDPLAPGDLTRWLDAAGLDYSHPNSMSGVWAKVVRPPLEGAGDWTHQYGNADNSASSHDTLEGATRTSDLAVQWIGRPGGDAVMDRNPRKPSPLAAKGRVFLQGLHRIIAMDSYNGAILWSLEIPDLIRTNMPRDASNWCVDEDHVYAAIKDSCWRIDAASGQLVAVYNVSIGPPQDTTHWGYVGSVGDQLLGSSTRKGAAYTAFMGHSSWYDQKSGYGTWKVCSDDVFALSKEDGDRNWTYSNGVIINSTITIGGGRVYFVECRNPSVLASEQRKVAINELWQDQYLVALDEATGGVLWEQPIDTADGVVVFYLGYTDVPGETLILSLSRTSYHMYAFDATDGHSMWNVQHSWPSDNHGGHMQHPVLLGGNAYLWPYVYRVRDGSRVTPNMPAREGCPTFAAGSRVFAYRGPGRIISVWDSESGRAGGWQSIRPGCWLSVIPAHGMILAPEGGAGCSCGGWLQTSVGYSRKE